MKLRRHAGAVEVRNTKANGDDPTLAFTEAGFIPWLDGAKDGQFDHLAG